MTSARLVVWLFGGDKLTGNYRGWRLADEPSTAQGAQTWQRLASILAGAMNNWCRVNQVARIRFTRVA